MTKQQKVCNRLSPFGGLVMTKQQPVPNRLAPFGGFVMTNATAGASTRTAIPPTKRNNGASREPRGRAVLACCGQSGCSTPRKVAAELRAP